MSVQSANDKNVVSVDEHLEEHREENKSMTSFVDGFPYGADTAFGYTTLVDPPKDLKKHAEEIYSHKLEDPNFGMNKVLGRAFEIP